MWKDVSSTKGTPYYRLQHPRACFGEVVALRVEGVSISAIARVKALAWNTVERWLEKAADACRRFNHGRTIGFAVEELQTDEIRTFGGSKDRPTWVFTEIADELNVPVTLTAQARWSEPSTTSLKHAYCMAYDVAVHGRHRRER